MNNTRYNITIPNNCPHCHVRNIPSHAFGDQSLDADGSPAYISVWRCANIECKRLFVALYKISDGQPKFYRFLDGSPESPQWPKPILDLQGSEGQSNKSKFIKIYLQSLESENKGLDELAGMGYRKAIEFLVKDWAIQNHPDEKDKIKNSWLGSVIKDFYDCDLKDILERATWLGNDQAHYIQLFGKFDLNVLKELIDLIIVELDRQYKKAHYINLIQYKK